MTISIDNSKSWKISYQSDCVKFIEAFRRDCWDHQQVCSVLHDFFHNQLYPIQTICELGSGAGTNLQHLHQFGYSCTGYELNSESIAISRNRANLNNQNIDFNQVDFFHDLPSNKTFDAVISLFVPISISDMEKLADRAFDIINPGGYFIAMLLMVSPEFQNVSSKKVEYTESLEVDGIPVVRFNRYEKSLNQIDYLCTYLAGIGSDLQIFKDTDSYDLLVPQQRLRPKKEYSFITRKEISGKPNQAPPMTMEVIDLFQKS